MAEGEVEEVDWSAIDANDPQQVARALATVGMQAGAKLAVVEHMNDRIGRALTKLDEATETLASLVPRAEMEEQLRKLREDVDAQRAEDRRRANRRTRGLAVIGALFATIILGFVLLNRAAVRRAEQDQERIGARTEATAVCASTYPGNREAIRLCVHDLLDD